MAKTQKRGGEGTGKSEKNLPDGVPTLHPDGSTTVLEHEIVPGIDLEGDDVPEDRGRMDKAHEATDSEFYASREEHLKQGRAAHLLPSTIPNEAREEREEEVGPGVSIPVPRPKFSTFKSDSTVPGQRNKSFYNWWNGILPGWAKKRTVVYVYREHPALIDPPMGADGKPVSFKYIDKISGEEPLSDDMDLLNRFGCGSYRLVMNESDNKSAKNRTLCTVYALHIGGNDYKSNPPFDQRINDPANVDPNFPGNATYLAFLRSKGILPEELVEKRRKEEQEELMATVAAVQQEATTVTNLTNKLVEMAEKKSAGSGDSLTEAAVRNVLDMQKDSSKAAIETVTKAADDRVRHMEETMKAFMESRKENGGGMNMEMMMLMIKMMEGGRSNIDSELQQLRAENSRLQSEQTKILSEQLMKLMEERRTNNSQFGSFSEAIKAMKEMRDTVEEFEGQSGRKGVAGDVAEGVADAVGAPKWLQAMMPVVPHVFQFLTTLVAGRNGATVPPPVPGAPIPQPNPMPQPMPSNVTQFPSPLQPPPMPAIPAAGTGGAMPAELNELLNSIYYPLGQYLADPGASGNSFGGFFVAGWTEEMFYSIKAAGPDAVLGALRMHPKTAQVLQHFPLERTETFIKEFLAYDPKSDEEEDSDDVKEPVENQPA